MTALLPPYSNFPCFASSHPLIALLLISLDPKNAQKHNKKFNLKISHICKSIVDLSKSSRLVSLNSVPEIIDPVFAKTSPKRSFSMTEYERFGLVFTKTRVYKFGHRKYTNIQKRHLNASSVKPIKYQITVHTCIIYLFLYFSYFVWL
jgi:hypothetical protein